MQLVFEIEQALGIRMPEDMLVTRTTVGAPGGGGRGGCEGRMTIPTTLCLDDGHVQRFAAAGGDANPLHVDAEFAYRTMYGQCIAHGALVALAALGVADAAVLRHARSLSLRFPRPTFRGDELTVRAGAARPGRVVVEAIAGRPQAATGLLEVRTRFGYGAASAQMRLHSFVRAQVPGPRREVLSVHLPPSDTLAGCQALVVGASRGVGAAIAGALAT